MASRCRLRSRRASRCGHGGQSGADPGTRRSTSARAMSSRSPIFCGLLPRSPETPQSRTSSGARAGAAFVRGVAAELLRAGVAVRGAELEIHGNLPRGAGLSSSAALEVALCLALLGLTPRRARPARAGAAVLPRGERVAGRAYRPARPARLALRRGRHSAAHRFLRSRHPAGGAGAGRWLAAGDARLRRPRTLAASGYNERRAECAQACELLGVESLREAQEGMLDTLPRAGPSREARAR